MIGVEEYELIRRAYFIEGLSLREIGRRFHHGRMVIRKALGQATPSPYRLKIPRATPVLEAVKGRIEELLTESGRMPPKQRYTAARIYQLLRQEGFGGSEVTVRRYVAKRRGESCRQEVFLPLEFAPGEYAQLDWGEAIAEIAGERCGLHLFVMRLNYSRARFAMVFPFEKQEAFFEGHEQAFSFFGAVPRIITYDNLKTAVLRVLEGRNRQEQEAFVAFRSHYLFDSRYCNVGQAHEKGGVEGDIGYVRRNFLTPLIKAGSYGELNARLYQECLLDLRRASRGEQATVAQRLEGERAQMLPLPAGDYPACRSATVKVNPYSQVVFETNRYSVPVQYAGHRLILRAYPFRVEVLSLERLVAAHERCFGREKDILEPLHYLPLLEQRPGAFEHAIPMRRWREQWPPSYERLLERLRQGQPQQGTREFLAILKLHRYYPAELVARAIEEALRLGTASRDGVELCLRQKLSDQSMPAPLDLSACPRLSAIGRQPVDLSQYDRLLVGVGYGS